MEIRQQIFITTKGEVCNSNCANSLLLLLHHFADLIIREAVGTPSPDRRFADSHYAADAPEVRQSR